MGCVLQSGVPDDGRKAFYTEVEWMSNCYAMGQLRMGMSYGHAFLPTNAAEHLRWDGVVAMDGVRGGSNGAILRRFNCPYCNTQPIHIRDSGSQTGLSHDVT
jgi:hypothetical protein